MSTNNEPIKKGQKRHFLAPFAVYWQKSTLFPDKFFRKNVFYILTDQDPTIPPNFIEIRGLSFFFVYWLCAPPIQVEMEVRCPQPSPHPNF